MRVFFFVILLAACGSSHDPGPTDAGRTDGGPVVTDAGSCPTGQSYFVPGCGSGEEVTIVAGCYQPCTGATDTSCPTGLACRRSDINPCVCPAGEGCCAACGAEQWLCLAPAGPPPSCEGTDYCGCNAGCEPLIDLSTGCVCPCDDPFNCSGEPCDCDCGGATYLGCAPVGQCATTEMDCGCPAVLVDGCPQCTCGGV